MKILINTPDLKILGGVSNHYIGLRNFWSHNVYYNTIGKRNNIPGYFTLPFDIIKFIGKCLLYKPDVILLNPSLGEKAIKRDAIYLHISKLLGIKSVVFIHGWDTSMEKHIAENPKLFIRLFKKAGGFLVLANEFKRKLIAWGITAPVYLTTTKVDDNLLVDFDLNNKPKNNNILFLSRIEKKKGIFIVIDTFIKLKQSYPELILTIAGDGSDLSSAINYANKSRATDINFTGRISGEKLKLALVENNIFLFPTAHGEGMPTSVLEAMSFGQVIVTTPIGGINDFFEEGKMGHLVKSYNSLDFYNKISKLIQNEKAVDKIKEYNFNYSRKNFLASKVAPRIETLLAELIKS